MFKQQLHFVFLLFDDEVKQRKDTIECERTGWEKKAAERMFLPPPKNNDCSNNTSSQTTTRDRKQFCVGLSLSLLALSITTSFCSPRIDFLRRCIRSSGKKKVSRSRCVIKCNLNWMAKKKQSGIESILSWWISRKWLNNTVESSEFYWSYTQHA